MTLSRRSFTVVVGFCLLSFGMACRHHELAAATTDNLGVNGSMCTQNVGGSAIHWVQVSKGDTVTWNAPNATASCSINFANTASGCPFFGGRCSYTCSGGTVTSDPVTSTSSSGTQYQYSSWGVATINNCQVGQDGFVMK